MYDLPRSVDEYYCIGCGERFWIKLEAPLDLKPSLESNPVKNRAVDSAAKRAQTRPPEEDFTFSWTNSPSAFN